SKVGRKPKDLEQKKTKMVSLYFSESDYQIIKERADKKRLSVSQYITSSLFE
ncbi:ribbon-helix-helix domain-containing protein, partial [Helicobacter sp. UBA3407]